MGSLPAGLYIVSTPIGNLGDMTARGIETLRGADVIACEDTRVTARLAQEWGLTAPRVSYREHNEARMGDDLVRQIAAGAAVALVSDAGTPAVSDPGQRLVAAVAAAGLEVTVLPGPSAAIAGLVLSGLPTDRFLVAGFPPAKRGERRRWLAELAATPATLVLYEAPHRLAASLADMADTLGDRQAAVLRELTKRFEEAIRDSLPALADRFAAEPARGEIVVVVAPPAAGAAETSEGELDEALRDALAQFSLRDAVDAVAGSTGVAKRAVYARALALSKG